MMRKLVLSVFVVLALLQTSAALAATLEKHAVTLEDGSKHVVEIVRGKPGAPVYVLLNGLVYDTRRWDPVTSYLAKTGATIVRSAFAPQPENLRLLKKGEEPKWFATGIELDDMARNLDAVLDSQAVTGPVQLVGLSYGASVATRFARLFPTRVENLVLIAPLVVPVDDYNAGGRSIRVWLQGVRFWENAPCEMYGSINPWLCVGRDLWYDSFYDFIYGSYLRERVKTIPPGVEEATYKKAIFHLVRAARDFDLKNETPRLRNVHVLVAAGDEAVLLADQKAAWKATRASEKRALVVFDGAVHALPDEAPGRLSEVLNAIATSTTYSKAKEIHVKADF